MLAPRTAALVSVPRARTGVAAGITFVEVPSAPGLTDVPPSSAVVPLSEPLSDPLSELPPPLAACSFSAFSF